ncbi:RluA family pseudouridine synthase [Tissierella sp. MB52-C2]|uniref:RluA family pseudouridine synthase n=1 Tax=Tissierella sp. MB52-C2 TaxID=3070999 RepID=UPI00280C31F0|nr:RluA family pseudouridine synthase [Tissierella sp. MB52-C2]WMM26904.1 RluA family pseudouridine synthase [Tissierella sp. MB52-C2]
MREITIDKNENEQRLDRFLKKYLAEAPQGFVYKMIRKKNVKLNGTKVQPETTIYEGDKIQLYLSDETIDKFIAKKEEIRSKIIPNIIYEDNNIILINKPIGILSHGASKEFEENIVDSMVSYLIQKGDFVPRIQKTFTPSICNRLDRNTSGIIIGAKNYEALKTINEAMKNSKIRRFYKTIVKGNIKKEFMAEGFLSKDEERNRVTIYRDDVDGAKKIETIIKPLKNNKGYSLLEIELITGRTHQIRGHLSSLGYPVIGDRKYGDSDINKKFKEKYSLENQWLHGYKIEFNGLQDELQYLNGKIFTSEVEGKVGEIEKDLFE